MTEARTTDYEFPWEWAHEYLKDRIRKNSVIEKRRKKSSKDSCTVFSG